MYGRERTFETWCLRWTDAVNGGMTRDPHWGKLSRPMNDALNQMHELLWLWVTLCSKTYRYGEKERRREWVGGVLQQQSVWWIVKLGNNMGLHSILIYLSSLAISQRDDASFHSSHTHIDIQWLAFVEGHAGVTQRCREGERMKVRGKRAIQLPGKRICNALIP